MNERRAGYRTKRTAARSSPGEEMLTMQLRARLITGWVRELRFHPVRAWRFDFAFQDARIAVEIEGGHWSRGRHTRGKGFSEDCLKYNEAALLGWRVLRFTTDMVGDGSAIEYLAKALQLEGAL